MTSNPVVLSHWNCMVLRPTSFRFDATGPVSSLNAAAISLVQLGADQILVPVSQPEVKEAVEDGIEGLPFERRRLIREVDADGQVLSTVHDYLEPLRKHATDWNEKGFLEALKHSLYNVALGCRYRATVARPRMDLVYDLLPSVDKSVFQGEARYRFAEIGYFLSQLEPYGLSRVEAIGERFQEGAEERMMDILQSVQFRRIVKTQGRLGLVRNPRVLLGALRRKVLALTSNRRFKEIIRAGSAVTELLGIPVDLDKAGDVAGVLGLEKGNSPSLIDLPASLEYQILLE